jgi:uncharacterized protein YjiS (DUF1127 family)
MFVRFPSIGAMLRELVRYIGGSPLSRRRQLDSLRGLDDHLLRDVGLCRRASLSGRRCDNGIDACCPHGNDGGGL